MITSTPHVDALLTALISGEPHIEAFAELTDEHEHDKALYVLLALLTESPILQERATRALGALGDLRAVEPLLEVFDTYMPTTAFDALLALGDPAVIVPLLMVSGANFEQQGRVIARFETGDLLRELSKGVNHSESSLRARVLGALVHFNDPWSIQTLIISLADHDEHIRGLSVYLLREMRIVEAVPLLIPHAADSHPSVRQLTAVALGELGDTQAIPALLPMLEDPEPTIRVYAAAALAALGNGSGLPILKRIGDRDHDALRIAARQAIDCLEGRTSL